MSRTTTPGIYTLSHWSSVAVAVAEHLKMVIEGPARTPPATVPVRSAIHSILKFLKSALHATEEGTLSQPAISINDYTNVVEVLRNLHYPIESRREARSILTEYINFLEKLPDLQFLLREEVETAQKVLEFLEKLSAMGESEAYGRRMPESHSVRPRR